MDNNKKMTEAEYRSAPGLNYSTLKKIGVSPLHFLHARDQPQSDNKAFFFGRALHAAILEPKIFKDDYVIIPEGINRGNSKAYKEFVAANEGSEILSISERDNFVRIANKVYEHPEARKMLKARGNDFEIPLFWEYRGHKLKSKLDLRNIKRKSRFTCDVKSTETIEPRKFFRSAMNYDYLAQAWFYQAANTYHTGNVDPWFWIAVEKKAPYDVAVIKATDEALAYGKTQIDKWLMKIEECESSGNWPGVAPQIIDFELPAWAAENDDLIIE